MAGLRHCGDPYITQQSFMLHSSQASGDLQLALSLSLLLSFVIISLLRPQEIFNWLYVVEETEEDVWEGGKLAWQVKYQHIDH